MLKKTEFQFKNGKNPCLGTLANTYYVNIIKNIIDKQAPQQTKLLYYVAMHHGTIL